MISYRIEDHGDYFQVYKVVPEVRGPRGGLRSSGCEIKLGNVYKPGAESFGEVKSDTMYVADRGGAGDSFHSTLGKAIDFLIGKL